MQQIQFISVTPEQLQNAIIEGIKSQLESLKTHFQHSYLFNIIKIKLTCAANIYFIKFHTLELFNNFITQ